jgi:hypothetical protein
MRALRGVINAVVGVIALATIALGGLWAADRAKRWDAPRWTGTDFEPLRAPRAAGARWMFVLNPACANCMATLHGLESVGWSGPGPVAVLIVDTPSRPGREDLDRIATQEVWWDRDNLWRERWGHRLYGEALYFDAGGRLVTTVAAGSVSRWLAEEGRAKVPAKAPGRGSP